MVKYFSNRIGRLGNIGCRVFGDAGKLMEKRKYVTDGELFVTFRTEGVGL